MKCNDLKLLFFLLFTAWLDSVNAATIMGGNIAWKYIGNDTFDITVNIYTDCNSPGTPSSDIQYLACGKITALSTSIVSVGDITPTCKTTSSRCKSSPSSFPYGVQKFVAKARLITTSLSSCCNVKVFWKECCRDSTISTGIKGNFYIEGTLNRCIAEHDNSPYPYFDPVFMIGNHIEQSISAGYKDEEPDSMPSRDSLVFYLTNPMSDTNTFINYDTPYSAKNPLYCNKGKYPVGLHNYLGDFSFVPDTEQSSVISYVVEEWSKDSKGIRYKKGEVRNDFQIMITDDLTNKNPYYDIRLNNSNFSFYYTTWICDSSKSNFIVNAYAANNKDSVSCDWNYSLSGAVTNHTKKGKLEEMKIYWEYKQGFAIKEPYRVTIMVTDNKCPIRGHYARTSFIYVISKPVVMVKDTFLCNRTFNITAKSNTKTSKWNYHYTVYNNKKSMNIYSYSDTANFIIKKSGFYRWFVSVYEPSWTCNYFISKEKYFPLFLTAQLPSDTTICRNNKLKIKLRNIADDGYPPKFFWSTGDTTDGTSIFPYIYSDTSISVYSNDSMGCIYLVDSFRITTANSAIVPVLSLRGDTLFTPKKLGAYQWFYNDTIMIPAAFDHYIIPKKNGLYSLEYRDGGGCISTSKSFKVNYIGIDEDYKVLHWEVYPNPVTESLNVLLREKDISACKVELYSVLGQKISEQKSAQSSLILDMKNIPAGVYILRLSAGNSSGEKRLIKF